MMTLVAVQRQKKRKVEEQIGIVSGREQLLVGTYFEFLGMDS